MTGTETTANDVNLEKELEKPKGRPKQKQLYTFKLLKGTNFPAKKDEDGKEIKPRVPESPFKVIPHESKTDDDGELILDKNGNTIDTLQEPRDPVAGEFGDHTKLWPGDYVAVDGKWAEHFTQNRLAQRIEKFV